MYTKGVVSSPFLKFPKRASGRGENVRVALHATSFKRKKMAKKLYVGGLPYSTSNDELKDAFSQAGNVESATVITDKMTGRSKGFGFVEMSSDAEAQKAIDLWNGKDFGGRNLTVSEARPLAPRN